MSSTEELKKLRETLNKLIEQQESKKTEPKKQRNETIVKKHWWTRAKKKKKKQDPDKPDWVITGWKILAAFTCIFTIAGMAFSVLITWFGFWALGLLLDIPCIISFVIALIKLFEAEVYRIGVEVIAVAKGKTFHIEKEVNQKDFATLKVSIDGSDHTIQHKKLYLRRLNMKDWLLKFKFWESWKHVARRFYYFYDVETKTPITYKTPTVSAEGLLIVNESTSLKKAMSELFSNKLDSKMIIFIIIAVAAVGVVLYLLLSGQFSSVLPGGSGP
jgi:VIT1/CCC1 family predicted Fe2+/Mn2+ transporter